jgi:hypothetical protein
MSRDGYSQWWGPGGGVISRCRGRVCGVGRSSRGGMDRLGYFVT